MEFLALAQQRYTTKKYDATQKVSAEVIQSLQQILRLSPSSINSQPWQFLFVENEATKAQLAAASYFNETKINEASHLVVFTAIDNIAAFEAQIEKHLPEGAVNYYKKFIQPQTPEQVKAWFAHQVYLSLGYFLSACASMGIDATPMEGVAPDKYNEILQLKDYTTLFSVAIGYRNPEDANQPDKKPKSRLDLEMVVKEI